LTLVVGYFDSSYGFKGFSEQVYRAMIEKVCFAVSENFLEFFRFLEVNIFDASLITLKDCPHSQFFALRNQ
jgi:hypothetical protein